MNLLIKKIEAYTTKTDKKIEFINCKLKTNVYTNDNVYYDEIYKFATAFNNLFECKTDIANELNAYIINDEILYKNILDYLNNDKLKETDGLCNFNKATISTSYARCTPDYNYYIIKCYEYFIYLFDKKKRKCYMLIRCDKKALTMINILILTPYLMYGELFAVHGGLVNKHNNNVLINNSSLGGKTTFALLFASNGWDIVTEETTYITNEGNILPYNIRNYFNIRVGTYINFYKFFKSKNIIIKNFIEMKNKPKKELFDYGKKEQCSIDFDKIGKFKNLDNSKITTSLKVSIEKRKHFAMNECSSKENVSSFLELSLAPTVMLFKELLNYDDINYIAREKQLSNIFNNTKSYIINSGLNYKNYYDEIIAKIKKNTNSH